MAPQDPCAPRVVLQMCPCSPRPQLPVCTPALHIPVTGECVDEQTGLGNGWLLWIPGVLDAKSGQASLKVAKVSQTHSRINAPGTA